MAKRRGSIAAAIKWMMPAIWTVLIVPVLGVFAVGLAAQWGWTSQPNIAALAKWIEDAAKAASPWYLYVLVAVAGLTVGLWLDRIIRKRGAEASRRLAGAGRAMSNALVRLDRPAFRVDENERAIAFLANATAIGSVLNDLGIFVPEVHDEMTSVSKTSYISHFFRLVGPTFRTGNIKASKELAEVVANEIEEDIKKL